MLADACARQVSLTSASDTSDLLGSYEQAEPGRAHEAAEQRLVMAAREACAAAAATGALEAAAAATLSWRLYGSVAASKSIDSVERSAALRTACAATTAAAAAAVNPAVAAAWSASLTAYDAFSAGSPVSAAGSFAWVDGVLLKAMASGDWVLLDNANLCSPTVLDRLNPLLEPAGKLLVPEAGLVGGAPRIVKPAPGFRLILALDPSHGEVSRAMRNRGIEVYLLRADECTSAVRTHWRHPAQTRIASIRVPADTPLWRGCLRLGPWPNSADIDSDRGVWLVCVWPRQPVQQTTRSAAALAAACTQLRHTSHFAPSLTQLFPASPGGLLR